MLQGIPSALDGVTKVDLFNRINLNSNKLKLSLSFFSVYVDADSRCNTLSFNLGNVGAGTSIAASRSWRVKVS